MKVMQLAGLDSAIITFLTHLNERIVEEEYDLVCVASKGKYTETIKNKGWRLINVNIARKIKPISNLITILRLIKVLKHEKPDILHVHNPSAAMLARIAAKPAKIPLVFYTAHGFYFHENMPKRQYWLHYNLEKKLCQKRTDFLFTQSEEDYEMAVRDGFISKNKALAIGNGVDIAKKFNPTKIMEQQQKQLKDELKIKEGQLVISFIGRLVEEKGILDLIEGFQNREYQNIVLLVIGDNVKHERDTMTKQKLIEYRKDSDIRFLGLRKDIPQLLAISDIFCLPSYREGMPRSIIEAMAMECAVIATNIRGCREEVIDGETGFLVPINQPTEIEEKIDQLARDTSLLNKMKKNGRKRAEQCYNEEAVVNKQLDIYRKLLNERRN